MNTASKKVINGWAMYDWANSVYNLVITTTFFPIYFLAVTDEHVTFLGMKFLNSSLYSYATAVAFLIVAFTSPILSSIADSRGSKKNFLKFFTTLGSLSCCALYFFDHDHLGIGVLAFILATIGYCGGLVFYNSFLPEIAAPEDRDAISAKGYSMGYIGSVILQVIGFLLVLLLPKYGSGDLLPVKLTFFLVGVWWFGFAQITFRTLPESKATHTGRKGNAIKEGFTELRKVFAQVKQLPVLKRFLRGFFFYSMGVQTIMLAATVFGSKVLNLPSTNLIVTIVIIQVVAIPGAWLIAKLSGKFGNLRVLIGVILLWMVVCYAGYMMKTAVHFYMLATLVGLIMGGIQSLSRSTYAKLMPETTDTASFFSYYDVTEKISIVIGMFTFAYIEDLTEDIHNSVLALGVFFLIGLAWTYSALKKQKELV